MMDWKQSLVEPKNASGFSILTSRLDPYRAQGKPLRHHYVPEFYLRRWATGGLVRGYYWDHRSRSLSMSKKGAKAFCHEVDLYKFASEPTERSHLLETKFLGTVDDKAGKIIGKISKGDLQSLTDDEACHWVRFLMSLEVRRPSVVGFLKRHASKDFIDALDADAEFLSEMEQFDIRGRPSEILGSATTLHIQDRMLLRIQEAIDDPEIGKHYLRMSWLTKKLSTGGIDLVVADRPFIREGGIEAPDNVWCLPLDPDTAFFCSNNRNLLIELEHASACQLSKAINRCSVEQADKYVFDKSGRNSRLLERLGKARTKPKEL